MKKNSFWMAVLFLFSCNTVSFAEDGKFIVNLLSGRCINVSGDPGKANGTPLTLADCQFSGKTDTNNPTDQKWILTSDGFIQNALSGKCIDVAGYPGTDNGAQLQIWDCELNNTATDQKWILTSDGFIKNVLSGRCIDVFGAPGTNSGAKIQLYDCESSGQAPTDQKWELLPQIAKGDIDGDNDVSLKDTIAIIQICAGIKPASTIYKNADANSDGKIGLAEAIYTLQIIAGVRFDKDLIITEIADSTKLGAIVTDSGNKEAMAIFGEKNSKGVLTSVTDIMFTSLTDQSKSLYLKFDADKLPESLEFYDGSKVTITNYTDTTADITVYDSAGNKVKDTVRQKLDIPKLRKAQALLKGDIQSNNICKPLLNSATTPKAPDWIEAAFLAIDVIGCAIATGEAVITGGLAIPLAMWSCGSFLLSAAEFFYEGSGIKPPAILQKINDFTGFAQYEYDCGLGKSAFGCVAGLVKLVYERYKADKEVSNPPQGNVVQNCGKPSINVTCNGSKSCTIACNGTASLEISYSGIKGGKVEADGAGIWGHFAYDLPTDSENDVLKLNVIHADAVVFNGCYGGNTGLFWVSITGSWGNLYTADVAISLERCSGGYSDILPCYYKVKQ